MTVHFGTFDVEAVWRPAELATLPSGPVQAGTGTMEHLLAVGAVPGDVLLTATPVPEPVRAALAAVDITPAVHVVPGEGTVEQRIAAAAPDALPDVANHAVSVYAVRPDTAAAVARLGLDADLPELAAVVRVNAKTWSNEFVVEHRLPGAAAVATTADALRRLATVGTVVKDPYGVAGRGALHLTSPRVVDTVVRHVARQAARGARVELLVQPWFDVRTSFSTHFTVGADGDHEWLGLQQVDNAGFTYRGSAPLADDRLGGAGHRAVMADLAQALAAAGYHGPVCVDGLVLRDGTVVPVLEVNARCSMGRLNLYLDRRAAAFGLRSWLRCGAEPAGPPAPGAGVLPLAAAGARHYFAVFAPATEPVGVS